MIWRAASHTIAPLDQLEAAMFRRVGLIALGGVIYVILRQFHFPMRISAVIALLPFGLMEAKNLTGPYEKSAHEILHETDAPSDQSSGPK